MSACCKEQTSFGIDRRDVTVMIGIQYFVNTLEDNKRLGRLRQSLKAQERKNVVSQSMGYGRAGRRGERSANEIKNNEFFDRE